MFSAAGKLQRGRGKDAYTSLLLHMEGSNNGTTFVDSSTFAHTITPVAPAVTSTAQAKFGSSSGLFTGGQLNIPDSTDLQIGSGDWTVEAFVYPTSSSGYRTIVAKRDTYSGAAYYSMALNGLQAFLYPGTGSPLTGGSVTLNAWNHVCCERYGSVTTLYVNGVGTNLGNITPNATYINHSQRIGALYNGNEAFAGYIDEVRISKGIARYKGNFTPPAAPFTI